MPDLTLEQVKAAGLAATTHQALGKHGHNYTIDYLPGNRNMERFRVTGDAPYYNTIFGPGGEHTPQDGWHHADGCTCGFCEPHALPITRHLTLPGCDCEFCK